ncbi:MAG: alpha-amylase [Ilumatobacteraceae bacterium]|nr:alpha-amylase [Ilumatobacteraceae bacterium]
MKDPALPDVTPASPGLAVGHPQWDQEGVHEIYRRWRTILDAYPGDRVFCGEVWLGEAGRVARYVRPDELHTAFNFHFLRAPWSASPLRHVIDETVDVLAAVGATPTWVLSNHDVVRVVTRYGGGAIGVRRARAAALLMLALPGAAYLYQGDELGLPEVEELPDSVRQDPTFWRTGGAQRGRDGCRVPIPWSGAGPSYGFGPASASWLPQPVTWSRLTRAEQLADARSTLSLYTTALGLRRALPSLGDGALTWLDTPHEVLAFSRAGGFACVTNLGDEPVDLRAIADDAEVLLVSDGAVDDHLTLASDSTAWLRQRLGT